MNSLSSGTCHWCHVMERESFEDRTVANILNKHFVSIKVDREERPDIDRVYMFYVQVRCIGSEIQFAHALECRRDFVSKLEHV